MNGAPTLAGPCGAEKGFCLFTTARVLSIRRMRQRIAGLAVILAVATWVVYQPSIRAPFLFDDVVATVENPTIRNLGRVADVLSPPDNGSGVTGRPVVNASLALNYALNELQPHGYHVFNVLLHIASGLLLFGIMRRTLAGARLGHAFAAKSLPVAFVAAGLWLLHPLQTESVTCVIQRTELLVGFFYLLTLYGLIRAAESPTGRGWKIMAVAACAAGMGSKEVMVSAPLILFLYDVIFLSNSAQEAWAKRCGLYLGIAATWIVLGYELLRMGGSRGTSAGFQAGMSSWSYLLTQCDALLKYLLLSVWPHPLVLDYGNAVVDDLASVAAQAVVLCALFAATIWGVTRRSPLAFCGACYFALLAPSSSVIPLVTQTIAEHRMYLPLAALIAPAICLVGAHCSSRVFVALAAGALALGVQTAARNAVLSQPLRLWTDNVAKCPGNPRGFDNLGLTLLEAGNAEAALPPYLRALALNPNSVPTHSQLGTAYLTLGRYDDAARHLTRALALDPAFVSARNNLGITLLRSGNPKGAKAQFEFLIAQRPRDIGARWNLGIALAAGGDFPGALAQLEQALTLEPNHLGVNNSYAEILAVAGQLDPAIARFERSLQLNPNQPEVREQLARLRAQSPNAKPLPPR